MLTEIRDFYFATEAQPLYTRVPLAPRVSVGRKIPAIPFTGVENGLVVMGDIGLEKG